MPPLQEKPVRVAAKTEALMYYSDPRILEIPCYPKLFRSTCVMNNLFTRLFFRELDGTVTGLTEEEARTRDESVRQKYVPALRNASIGTIIATPSLLLVPKAELLGSLIPVAMVAGTAWFSISLSTMKAKFQQLGLALTRRILEAFLTSLGILFVVCIIAFMPLETCATRLELLPAGGRLLLVDLGLLVVARIFYLLLAGALQYDINDAMLAGQNEVAEKYYRSMLGELSRSAHQLRSATRLDEANVIILLASREILRRVLSDDNEPVGVIGHELEKKCERLICEENDSLAWEVPQKTVDRLFVEILNYLTTHHEDRFDTGGLKRVKEIRAEINDSGPQYYVDILISQALEILGEAFR